MALKFSAVLLTAMPAVFAAPPYIQDLLPAGVVAADAAMITAPPSLTDRTPTPVQRRDILSDLSSFASSAFSGLSGIPSDVSSAWVSGVQPYFQNLPTGSAVASSLGLNDSEIAALPTQILNIPGYANWTDEGWNLLVHGNVYKQPNISTSKLNDFANVFLIGVDITSLNTSEQDQARNLSAEIAVIQQDNRQVYLDLVPNFAVPTGLNGGLIAAKGGSQQLHYPENTTAEGDFVAFIPLKNATNSTSGGYLLPGNETTSIQALNLYAFGSDRGNASAYLVPTEGITIISDIDDILRVTKIYDPKEGLLNSFARPFTPWLDMPEYYANWSRTIPDFHFHYLTTTPEQITANYMDFIYKTYPLGSFDTRPLNFSDVSATLSIRKFLLERIFQTYPKRKFILVADTSNSDVMRDYPEMVTEFPDQVQCIWLRNTSATDSSDLFYYDTSGFKNVSNSTYMFFNTPTDLTGLDVMNGECRNTTFAQNATFERMGGPFDSAARKKWGEMLGLMTIMPVLVMVMVAI